MKNLDIPQLVALRKQEIASGREAEGKFIKSMKDYIVIHTALPAQISYGLVPLVREIANIHIRLEKLEAGPFEIEPPKKGFVERMIRGTQVIPHRAETVR